MYLKSIRIGLLLTLGLPLAAGAVPLSLKAAIVKAQQEDPWLLASKQRQQALLAKADAAAVLPDPRLAVGVMNLGADNFSFGAQDMTQLSLSVMQALPRGDSLALSRHQLKQQAGQFEFARQNRQAKVGVSVAQLWLDIYKARQSIALIEQNRELFEQLADVAQASYASALGKTRQQDIVRAQLELSALEDRLVKLKQTEQVKWQQLSQWLSIDTEQLPSQLPQISAKGFELPSFSRHPAFLALEQQIKAGNSAVQLAKEQFKPQWTLNAGYGYRADRPNGQDRADLLSVGVSFDLPLHTEQRQGRQVDAAIAQAEAIKTDKLLLLRQFTAQFRAASVQYEQLTARARLYRDKLLVQSAEQAEAALSAYTNDDGDFAEVVRARIAELNAKIEALDIVVEKRKSAIQINYFFVSDSDGGLL